MKRDASAASIKSRPVASVSPSNAGSRYLDGFIGYLTAEKRLAKLTVENYRRDVAALIALAGGAALAKIQVHQIRRFIAQLHAQGLSGKSLARMLSAWRGFYAYLARDHRFPHNPCAGVRAPKSPKTLPQALSPDQAAQFLAHEGGDAAALRDKAVFELFYSSGLRLSELAGLNVGDINFQGGEVRVTGKGAKTRIVPVGRMALQAIQSWESARGKIAKAGEQALFLNRAGARISQRAIQYRMKQWALKQGIGVNLHPHMLRHSFASHVLQSSGDLRAVQEMLGHASISTTQIYTHLDFQYLAKVYDAAHPRAKKKA